MKWVDLICSDLKFVLLDFEKKDCERSEYKTRLASVEQGREQAALQQVRCLLIMFVRSYDIVRQGAHLIPDEGTASYM